MTEHRLVAIMANYYVTFGQKYHREPHPDFPRANPDGWLRVIAEDYESARKIVTERMGPAWAFMYTEDDFKPEYHPLGELGVWTNEHG